jgi:hypothetical protein
MLIALITATLLALLAGQLLPQAMVAAPAFWAHLVLAVGVMTLITAAMQHFVPVLTRSRGAGRWMARLPLLMLAAGGCALAVFSGGLGAVWTEAGRTAARHAKDRARITRWNSARALLFLTAAVLPLLGFHCSGMPALTALVWFGIVFALWVYRDM